MKPTAILLLLLISLASKAGEFVVEGVYDGKNLFFANPVRENESVCAYAVYVNGHEIAFGTLSGAFEIDFAAIGLKIGDPFIVRIIHHDDCKPNVMK